MIKEKFKSSKGVSLAALAITTVVLMILANIIIYNTRDHLKIGNLREMQNDIANLRDKISSYYAQNGQIPAKIPYTNMEHLKTARVLSDVADTGEFLVIDLSSLDNLTLNRGQDYEKIKTLGDDPSQDEVNRYTDLYIINKASHNIFYVAGITIDNETFYTDLEEVDKEPVDLRYVEGVKIPDGFYYVGGTKDTGIVISDVPGDDLDNTKQGNQFVWVPVPDITKFKRIEGYENESLDNKLSKCSEPFADGYVGEDTEYTSMYNHVRDNGGFYIGRYEVGKNDNGKAVIKKGVDVYNNIGWNSSGNMNDKTGGAVEQAEKFAENNGYTGVTSTLVYGVQWDATMQFMDSKYIDGTCNDDSYVKNSSGKGHYDGESPVKTGYYAYKNIYDMGGNVCEWIMEAYTSDTSDCRAGRGGSYVHKGSYRPASNRNAYGSGHTHNSIGFRVALYLNEEDEWSPTYDIEGTYKDKNGDTVYIPQGFQVSETPGEKTIDDGLVVRDSKENEWVWIEVPKTKNVYRTAGIEVTDFTDSDYQKIEDDLKNYTKDYRNETAYKDEWYSKEQHGFTDANNYNNHKKSMLKSVYQNGGFYIGRYEVGANAYVSSNDNKTRGAIIKQNAYPYNYVTCKQAQELSSGLATGGKTGSLMFGVQWDLVLKYIEEKGTKLGTTNAERKSKMIKTTYDLGSSDWGNYKNVNFTITQGQYSEDNGATYKPVDGGKGYPKPSNDTGVLLTTGATERNSVLNIYDLAGNEWEWTLEYTSDANYPCASRGGIYNNSGSNTPASYRNLSATSGLSGSRYTIGFRPALW